MIAKVEIINSGGVVEVDIDGQVSENVDIDAANIEVLETNVGGLSTIFGASDTNFNSLADIDALFYDAATGKWLNSPAYFEYIKTQNFVGLPVHMETLQQWIDHIYSAGRVHGLELTDNLDGTVDITSGVSIMRAVDDPHTTLYSVNIDGVSDLAFTNNQTNFIYAEYDSVSPTIGVTLNPNDINLTTKVPLFVVVREGTHLSIYNVGEDSVDSNASLRKRFFYTEKFRRADGGAIIYDSGALHIGCTAGEFYFGLTSFTFDAFDTTGADTFEYYRLINGAWIRVDESTVSNTEYNDISVSGSESLVSLGASKYAVHWVYLIGSTTNPHFAVVYSQDFYSNLAGAEAATVPSNVPPSIEGLGILLGRVIARQGDSEIISTDSSFTETFSSSLATSHNGLADLQGGVMSEYYHLTSDEYTGFKVGDFISAAPADETAFDFDTTIQRTTGNLVNIKDNGGNDLFTLSGDGKRASLAEANIFGSRGVFEVVEGTLLPNFAALRISESLFPSSYIDINSFDALIDVVNLSDELNLSFNSGSAAFTFDSDSGFYGFGANRNLGSNVLPWYELNLTGDIVTDSITGLRIGSQSSQKLGFWGAAAVVQPSGTGEAVGFTQGAGSNVQDVSTFTGNSGSTAYRINDIVKALKQIGILAV